MLMVMSERETPLWEEVGQLFLDHLFFPLLLSFIHHMYVV